MGKPRRDISALEGAIAQNRAVFVSALSRGDAAAAAAVYTDGARLLAPSAELMQGRHEIAAFWQAGIDSGMSAVEIQELELDRRAGVAYEVGRYALLLQPAGGGTIVDRGKYALVHEQQSDGSWLRAVETFNPDAP
jgi:ketosteroid isomerase-like protein